MKLLMPLIVGILVSEIVALIDYTNSGVLTQRGIVKITDSMIGIAFFSLIFSAIATALTFSFSEQESKKNETF